MAKIYTKTGDKGTTQLVGGQIISKADDLLELYGGLDEINSFIGLALSLQAGHKVSDRPWDTLNSIQLWLFRMGAHLATPARDREKFKIPSSFAQLTIVLEKQIDDMTSKLPPLKQFILPGGSASASALHSARAICRRVERKLVRFIELHPSSFSDDLLPFINRLSDFLFVAARYVNMLNESKDVLVTI